MILLWARFGTTSFTLADSHSTWCPEFQACTAMPFLLSHFFTAALCSVSCFLGVLPFVVYKGKHLDSAWTNGGPAGAIYGVSESGWMEKSNFLSWFSKLFLPSVLKSGPVVLIFDGNHSHISIELLELARSNLV